MCKFNNTIKYYVSTSYPKFTVPCKTENVCDGHTYYLDITNNCHYEKDSNIILQKINIILLILFL